MNNNQSWHSPPKEEWKSCTINLLSEEHVVVLIKTTQGERNLQILGDTHAMHKFVTQEATDVPTKGNDLVNAHCR